MGDTPDPQQRNGYVRTDDLLRSEQRLQRQIDQLHGGLLGSPGFPGRLGLMEARMAAMQTTLDGVPKLIKETTAETIEAVRGKRALAFLSEGTKAALTVGGLVLATIVGAFLLVKLGLSR